MTRDEVYDSRADSLATGGISEIVTVPCIGDVVV